MPEQITARAGTHRIGDHKRLDRYFLDLRETTLICRERAAA
jgi:hypothetical protein